MSPYLILLHISYIHCFYKKIMPKEIEYHWGNGISLYTTLY